MWESSPRHRLHGQVALLALMVLTNSHLQSRPLHRKSSLWAQAWAAMPTLTTLSSLEDGTCCILVSSPLASSPVWTQWMDPGPDWSLCPVWNCWQLLFWSSPDPVCSGAAALPSGQEGHYCLFCGYPHHVLSPSLLSSPAVAADWWHWLCQMEPW